MANKIKGTTDTTGALSTITTNNKAILIVGEIKKAITDVVEENRETIFNINSTIDAKTAFGSLSPTIEMVKSVIINKGSNIKGIVIGEYGEGKTYTTKIEAYAGALAKTFGDDNIGFVQFDQYETPLIDVLKTHLAQAEGENLFRYSFICMTSDETKTNDEYITYANTINNNRIFLSAPIMVDYNNMPINGVVQAAALATVVSNEMIIDPAMPYNGVEVFGFGGVERTLMSNEKDLLVNGGVVPIYASNGRIYIYRLVTTYTKDTNNAADIIWQEGTTRFIADYVYKAVETRLRTNYQRTKNVVRILDSMRTDVIDVLETINSLEIIQNFDKNTVSVIKDKTDIYGALVDYEFTVVTPLYTITINQHMKV